MSPLNGIISRNAALCFATSSLRPSQLARRMDQSLTAYGEKKKEDTMRRTLDMLFSNKRKWTASYIEAFCHALDIEPADLLDPKSGSHPKPQSGRKKRASELRLLLSSAFGEKVGPREAEAIEHNVTQILKKPGMYDLVGKIANALLGARSAQEARDRVSEAILEVDPWTPRRARPAGKKARKRPRNK